MKKAELKKELFKQVFGAMVDIKYCELSEDEILRITCGAIRQFTDAYSLKHAIAKQNFSDLGDQTKYRNLSWANFGFKAKAEDFKNNIINSGAITAN